MLQRKAHDKLGQPPTATKKTPSTSVKLMPSSPLYPPDSSSTGKGARVAKNREINKPRGSNMASASPNYMKPTTCSDSRKERLQVTPESPAPASDKGKIYKIASTSDSKASSCSLPVTKTLRSLARKASLRPRRPSMKKSSATALSPRKGVRRATCSSTLKDSKFPKVLDLNPGEKEAELTSVIKVCPFDFCSLNGRRHQHSHPLKRLPSARRRSLKAQKSLKLKRLASVRGRSFSKGRRSISSGKTKRSQGSRIRPIIKEVSDDFFVEIYAKPQENDLDYSNCEKGIKGRELIDRELSKILHHLESMEDDVDVEFSEEETEEFNRRVTFLEIPEIYNQISFGDDLDQSSDISFDDMYDDDANIPDYEAKEKTLLIFHQDHEIWGYQCCGTNVEENKDVCPENSKGNFPSKAINVDYEEEAGYFAGTKSESCVSNISEENDAAAEGYSFGPKGTLVEDHGGQVPERRSTDADYEEEAAGSIDETKTETSNASNELSLAVGLSGDADNVVDGTSQEEVAPERDTISQSEVALVEDNDDYPEYGKEGSKDSSEETTLSDGLLVQGSDILSSNGDISDLLQGNDQYSDILDSSIPPKQHSDVIDTRSLQMESCQSVDLERPNIDAVNPIIAEATIDRSDNGKGRSSSVIHSITLEDEIGGGKTEDSNIIGFEKEKYESAELKGSELDNINLRIDSHDAEIGDDKDEENNANDLECEESEQEGLDKLKLAAGNDCPDILNLSIAVENEIQSGKDQENIVSFGRKFFEEEPEESEFTTDDESPENIDLRVVAEDADTESGKAEENRIFFGSEGSEGLQESELAVYDKRPDSIDNIYVSVNADDASIGVDKYESNNGLGIKKSVREALEVSKLATDGEDEENINVCDARQRTKRYLEGSEWTRDDECAENVNLGSSESENAEPDDHEKSGLSTGDESPDDNLKISKEDATGDGKHRDHNLIEEECSGCLFEIYGVHQNQTVSSYRAPQLEIENCSSCDAMEHSSTPNKIPDSISIDLTEDTNSEYNQISQNHQPENNGVFSDNIFSDNLIIAGKTRCSETPEVCDKKKVRRRRSTSRSMIEMEMLRLINPRAPRFLPLHPDPEDEKVDLRHQLMDERKSADAWMIDSALQKVVKKLAPARKRKVALLIEAFEAVTPCDSTLMSPTSGFGKPIQACS